MEKVYGADPATEIAGSAAKSMVDNLSTPDIKTLIVKHGLDKIELTDWVPLHKMCDLFNDVAASQAGGASQTFVVMGMRIAEQSEFPPEMLEHLTVPVMVMGWDDHYKVNHRGGTLQAIVPKKISETQYEIHMVGLAHPDPYDMTYGMVYGFCRKLLPKGTKFTVSYDEVHSPYNQWQDGVILKVQW